MRNMNSKHGVKTFTLLLLLLLTSIASCTQKGSSPADTLENLAEPGKSSSTQTELGPTGSAQSMADYEESAIGEWGPIDQVIQMPTGPSQYASVALLDSGDPFTPTYQLPSGTLVKSSRPIEELIEEEPDNSHPDLVEWNGPSGTVDVFEGEIMITFVETADQQDIEGFITEHDLEVVFSWFVAGETSGNEIAWFQFAYDTEELEDFEEALDFFEEEELVEYAEASMASGFVPDYRNPSNPGTPLTPNDNFYASQDCMFVNELGIDDSTHVTYGPESLAAGQNFNNQIVAIIDDGVYRDHEELWYIYGIGPGSTGLAGKATWVGVKMEHKSFYVGRDAPGGEWYGEPNPAIEDPLRGGSLSTHGTQIAGLITGGTNNDRDINDGEGIASLAPATLVIPFRLDQTLISEEEGYGFTSASIYKSINALYDHFKPGQWSERVRVANMSFGHPDPQWGQYHIINADQQKYDRLYVGGAGNLAQNIKSYPGAFDNVLGVSGLWRNHGQDEWYQSITVNNTLRGSNYRTDSYATYPVSGIYGFTNGAGTAPAPVGRVISTPWANSNFGGLYDNFGGTSAATAQVSALAALLFSEAPTRQYYQIWEHIVDTRDQSMEGTQDNPYIAGVIDYDQALSTWP